MFSAVRRRLSYANVAMTLVLVFAMTGGAYAAGKVLITSTKQIKPSVLKQLRGKAGAQGPAGPAGTAGPQGPAGANGKDGAPGSPGEKGAQGAQGVQGIQGVPGKNGTTGFTETLPSKKTETGVWAFSLPEGSVTDLSIASFSIPLASALTGEDVHVINEKGEELHFEAAATTPTKCGEPVGTVAEPAAAPGNLCIYIDIQTNAAIFSEGIVDPSTNGTGAGKAGALLQVFPLNPNAQLTGHGTWAVTAP
jgi:hypothetical protein